MHAIDEFLGLLKAYNSRAIPLDSLVPIFLQIDDFHNFMHYISDEDIRLKDGNYASIQAAELAKFIAAIEAGNYEQANKITFLGCIA